MTKHVQFNYAKLSSHCPSKSLLNRYKGHTLDRNFTKPHNTCSEMNLTLCNVQLHNERMNAGIDHNSSKIMGEKKYVEVKNNSKEKCGCLGNQHVTPRMNLCDVCGGYVYSGGIGCVETPHHNIDAKTVDQGVPSDTLKFTCCPCHIKPSELRKLKLKAAEERLKKNNPLIGGPYADKLMSIFSPSNKSRQSIIVGYHSDGAPIYVSVGGTSNVIGYNYDGSPILAGQAGVADKNLVMGYAKDGTPIHPPPNSNPKESMALIGTYVKDGSPIIGNIKLWGGMIVKGMGKDGNPAYAPLSNPVTQAPRMVFSSNHIGLPDYFGHKLKPNDKLKPGDKLAPHTKGPVRPTYSKPKSSEISKVTTTTEQKKKADLERLFKYYTKNRLKDPEAYKALMRVLENFYPHCHYHKTCLQEHELVPKNKGWKWQNRVDKCVVQKLPYLFSPYYKPGAVPKCIARLIEKEHNSRNSKSFNKYCISYV